MIFQRQVSITVFYASCSGCAARGPDALNEVDAGYLALGVGWRRSGDDYFCSNPDHDDKVILREKIAELRSKLAEFNADPYAEKNEE